MQTIQQLRARHALHAIRALRGKADEKKIKARTAELPFMIHANGLGQAAAFFKSKKENGYTEVFALLQSWLTSEGRPFAGKSDLMEALVECDLCRYRVAQAEAMQYMEWAKKFASAYL